MAYAPREPPLVAGLPGSPEVRERAAAIRSEIHRWRPLFARPDVKRAMLVGSAARGHVGLTSDVDVVIVQETDKRPLDRSLEWVERLEARVALDVLVYTPEEFAREQHRPFLSHALRDAKVLYEA